MTTEQKQKRVQELLLTRTLNGRMKWQVENTNFPRLSASESFLFPIPNLGNVTDGNGSLALVICAEGLYLLSTFTNYEVQIVEAERLDRELLQVVRRQAMDVDTKLEALLEVLDKLP